MHDHTVELFTETDFDYLGRKPDFDYLADFDYLGRAG
jgi:hypothetical protein